MSLFSKNDNVEQTVSPRQKLESRYASSRHNILVIVALTLINAVLLVADSNSYFLFSAYVPYMLVDGGMFFGGFYPDEYYGEDLAYWEPFNETVGIVMFALAAVALLLYLLCWVFSNKRRVGWMIFALVQISIDTVIMLLVFGISADQIIDLFFHGWIIVSLGMGIAAHFKLKKLPEEPEDTYYQPLQANPEDFAD